GAFQALGHDHESSDGDQGFVAESREKIGGPYTHPVQLNRKEFKPDEDPNQDEEAGRFQSQLFPSEQEHCHQSEQDGCNGMQAWWRGQCTYPPCVVAPRGAASGRDAIEPGRELRRKMAIWWSQVVIIDI